MKSTPSTIARFTSPRWRNIVRRMDEFKRRNGYILEHEWFWIASPEKCMERRVLRRIRPSKPSRPKFYRWRLRVNDDAPF